MAQDLQHYIDADYFLELTEDDDGNWIAEYPELPGCIACGDSVPEAMEIVDSIKLCWIISALETGERMPEAHIDNERITS